MGIKDFTGASPLAKPALVAPLPESASSLGPSGDDPARKRPLKSAVFLHTNYGDLGMVTIVLPECNGGDEQFDADFEATLAFVKGVMSRRKLARDRDRSGEADETRSGSAEGKSPGLKGIAQTIGEDQ